MDRSKLGYEFPPITFPIERGKILEFARAIGDDNPIYRDVYAARAAGFADVPAPPTFDVVASFWRETDRMAALELDPKRTLHGEAAWEYLAPVVAGDTLTCTERVIEIAERDGKSGPMTFVVTELTFTNQRDEVVRRHRDTIIELSEAPR